MKAPILILTVLVAGAAFGQRYGGAASQHYGSVAGFGSVLNPGLGHAPTYGWGASGYGGHGHYNNRGGYGYGYGQRRYRQSTALYPVFIGGYGYGYGLIDDPPPPQQQEPQTIVVQQPPMAQAAPPPTVIINQYFKSDGTAGEPQQESAYRTPGSAPAVARSDDKPTIYLIAMKDHTIMPALWYWVEGDTLSYITSQGNKNSVSMTLVDKDFSKQLNDERHVEFNL